jgi:bacteriochlorophyllide a dehydrogenase
MHHATFNPESAVDGAPEASLDTSAVVFEQPGQLSLARVELAAPQADDCVVDVEWSGISTGTERLLWLGRMPSFPGMGYPLVPGYESVGRIVQAGPESGLSVGQRVFVPGSKGFASVRGLFGGAAARVVAPSARLIPIDDTLGERGVLLALAATAYHALAVTGELRLPDLIVGHGVLGRLLARLVVAVNGEPPTVWETNPQRRDGAFDYPVVDPVSDGRADYRHACDVSGSAGIVDTLVTRLGRGGRITLAGFYEAPVAFDFPPAFMREIGLQIAAEWRPDDLTQVIALVDRGSLSLDGLITHRETPERAEAAYRTAFADASCLKMILDWRNCQ